ncbi:reverse transcriptase domain-containing protein [Tanacetum coccineum]
MAKEDEEKTAFITSQGIFCYSKMPFGLRNARATYQRLVDKAFHKCTKKSDFHWTEEAESAFKQMKQLIAKLPLLTAPEEKEELIVYLAASKEVSRLERSRSELHINRKIGSGTGLWIEVQMGNNHSKIWWIHVLVANPASKILHSKGSRHDPIPGKEIKEKSINKVEVLAVVEEEGDTWMTPIYEYLTEEILPAEVNKARAVRRKSQRFAVINGILYKKSFLEPWLRYVRPLQENYVLRDIHEGSCSMHAGTRSLVAIDLRTRYYWPTMHKDARTLSMQRLSGPGKVKFLIVAIDYFTKWIEAKPVATITGNQVKIFVLDNIVCRFGLPREIISDNGKQFQGNPFKDWCEKLCIRQSFASVKHPQANGLVERENRSLGEGIKARLDTRSKNWMEEISHVLWAHRTMIKSSNGDTPFSLTYGTEVVIPAEIGMPTLRTAEVDMVQNDEALEINLDLLEERREQAAIREAKSKAKMEKYYNSKDRSTSFKPGDLMYRSNDASRAEEGGKLGPKWEGPYEVTKALGKGAYKLRDRDGKQLPRTWNVRNLKKCYVHEM